jgi:uncharacterized protein (TIGR02246 family)
MTESDLEEVRRTVNEFAETWNRHDMEAFGALFAPDADFVNVTGHWWKGRHQIHANHAFVHGKILEDLSKVTIPSRNHGIFKDSTYHFDRIDVRFINEDVAVAHGVWTMLGDSRTQDPRYGMMTFVVVRESQQWRVSVAQNTEINRIVQ